ncbi:MAG: hypothetical protein QOJ80_5411 [Mycobacterium sp.]|nr:hypothetical protein [Mycobacterium sp.]
MMSLRPNAASRVRYIRTLGASSIAATLATIGAVLAVIAESPVPLRILALVVLLMVPGVTLVRLLTGGDPDSPRDPAVRVPLAILLGILVWLAVALSIDAVGLPLASTGLALGVGACGLGLAIVAGLRREPRSEPRSVHVTTMRASRAYPAFVSVLAAAVVVAVAAYLASTMITRPVERYTTLGLSDNKPYAGETPAVRPRDAVRLNWILRGFGCTPSPTLTRVRLTVDGVAMDGVAVDLGTDETSDGGATLDGAVTFTAPAVIGRHLVELAVLPAADGGAPLPEPGYVSTFLEVEK